MYVTNSPCENEPKRSDMLCLLALETICFSQFKMWPHYHTGMNLKDKEKYKMMGPDFNFEFSEFISCFSILHWKHCVSI